MLIVMAHVQKERCFLLALDQSMLLESLIQATNGISVMKKLMTWDAEAYIMQHIVMLIAVAL
jgi:hypothetical protein